MTALERLLDLLTVLTNAAKILCLCVHLRQTDRQLDRHTDGKTVRQTDRQTDRGNYSHTHSTCTYSKIF